MSSIRTNAAAEMLGVSPNTLRSWERRFGYPRPVRTPGGHRQYDLRELEALRQAFVETHNVSSAISVARERGEGPSTAARLEAAFGGFDEQQAARLLEEGLMLRSLERVVDELLVPAVAAFATQDADQPAPELQFAWRYATGWLAAAQRTVPPSHRPEGVLIFDATARFEPDALRCQGLELALRRGGLRTLTLTVGVDPQRLQRALRALEPSAVVLAGRNVDRDQLGRLVYATRTADRQVEVFDYCSTLSEHRASTVCRLDPAPLDARDTLLARLAARASGTAPAGTPRRAAAL